MISKFVGCTLNGTDLKAQRERWIALVERFGTDRRKIADGVRLTFRDDPAVAAELQALVRTENHCCGWASWSVEREDGALVMAAHSRGNGVAALQAMFCSVA